MKNFTDLSAGDRVKLMSGDAEIGEATFIRSKQQGDDVRNPMWKGQFDGPAPGDDDLMTLQMTVEIAESESQYGTARLMYVVVQDEA